MRFRKLRIAWSLGVGIACVMLIGLWVRSYRWADVVHIGARRPFVITFRGQSYFGSGASVSPFNPERGKEKFRDILGGKIHVTSVPITLLLPSDTNSTLDEYNIMIKPVDGHVVLPFWLLIFLAIATATVPWLPWRFSLRTLLIATTLVAVVLGLALWAAHH